MAPSTMSRPALLGLLLAITPAVVLSAPALTVKASSEVGNWPVPPGGGPWEPPSSGEHQEFNSGGELNAAIPGVLELSAGGSSHSSEFGEMNNNIHRRDPSWGSSSDEQGSQSSSQGGLDLNLLNILGLGLGGSSEASKFSEWYHNNIQRRDPSWASSSGEHASQSSSQGGLDVNLLNLLGLGLGGSSQSSTFSQENNNIQRRDPSWRSSSGEQASQSSSQGGLDLNALGGLLGLGLGGSSQSSNFKEWSNNYGQPGRGNQPPGPSGQWNPSTTLPPCSTTQPSTPPVTPPQSGPTPPAAPVTPGQPAPIQTYPASSPSSGPVPPMQTPPCTSSLPTPVPPPQQCPCPCACDGHSSFTH